MTKKRMTKTDTVPPQLIGVHIDAVEIGPTAPTGVDVQPEATF